MTGIPPGAEFNTFTVLGRCARTGRLGIGTATPYYKLRQVDARVPPLPDWLRDRGR